MRLKPLILSLALLAGLAADRPHSPLSVDDRHEIERLVRKELYQPITLTLTVCAGPTKGTAIVERLERREGREVVVESLTLKKTKRGWEVESRAR